MASRKPESKDYYSVLGVTPGSDSAEIKKAYRALVHKFHRYRIRDKEEITNASERMIELNEAFAVLADAKRRAEFDREKAAASQPAKPAAEPVADWEMPMAPGREKRQTTKRNAAVEQS